MGTINRLVHSILIYSFQSTEGHSLQDGCLEICLGCIVPLKILGVGHQFCFIFKDQYNVYFSYNQSTQVTQKEFHPVLRWHSLIFTQRDAWPDNLGQQLPYQNIYTIKMKENFHIMCGKNLWCIFWIKLSTHLFWFSLTRCFLELLDYFVALPDEKNPSCFAHKGQLR